MYTRNPHFWEIMRDGRAGPDRVPHRWPELGAHSLAILADLGMSDAQIALYFKIPEDNVAALQRHYGLN